MAKKKLSSYEQFTSIDNEDVVFGKKTSGSKYGFFPASLIHGNGYACRRWLLDGSSPTGEAVGNLDYLRNLPNLLGLGCYLVDDAHARKKLDPTNHYKLATGETAKLDGSMGQYMWGWRTPFYIAYWIEGEYQYMGISLKPIPGKECYKVPVASISAIHAGVMDRTNDKLCSLISTDAQYRGGGGSALTTGNASADNLSMLGYPATVLGTSTFEQKGANRGSGWGAGWYWIDTVIATLFYVIMGTKNCQASYNANKDANGLYQGGLGTGVSDMPNWSSYNNYYPVIPTSAGVELADGVGISYYPVTNSSGTTVYNAPVPVFFGLKNLYGHLWHGKNRIVGVKQSDASYRFFVAKSSLTTWDYSKTSEMLHVGDWLPGNAGNWEYSKTLNFNGLAGMPSSTGATSSTYYCDGAYGDTATSGSRAPLGVGTALYGGIDGLACFSGDYAPSCAYAALSSSLCEVDGDFNPVPQVYAA